MSEKLKIVVCHHKDAPMLQQYVDHPELYVHIHAGRAISNDQSPFLRSIAGDDIGVNISSRNAEVNEFTALYWVWKNYDKVGNPDFIGLNHYRRAFTQEDIEASAGKDLCVYEDILKILGKQTMKDQFLMWHSERIIQHLFSQLKFLDGDADNIESGFMEAEFHPKNMFIAKRETFFDFMKFMEKYLKVCMTIFKVDNTMDYVQKRTSSFVLERISSIYFTRLLHSSNNTCTFKIPESYI